MTALIALLPVCAALSCRSSERDTSGSAPPASNHTPATAEAEGVRASTDHTALARAPLTALDPPAGAGAMAANLSAHGEELLASWLEPAPAAPEAPEAGADGAARVMRLRVARLRQGAWSPPVTVVESARLLANWADVPLVVAGPGESRVAYYMDTVDAESFAYDLMIAASADGGDTWKLLGKAYADTTRGEHGFVSSVASAGGVRAFWLDGRAAGAHGHGHTSGGAMTLRTTLVRGQEIAEEDRLLDERVCDCCGTAAAMTADGPIVVYRDRSADDVRDIASIRLLADRVAEPVLVHRDNWRIAGCPVNGPRVVARGRDVAVAWYTYAGETPRVRVAFSDDAGASFSPPVEVDGPHGARAPLGRVDLVLADSQPDGPTRVVVTWMASERERALVLARSVDRRGGLGDTVALVETRADRAAGFPRLARIGASMYLAWVEPGASSSARVARVALRDIPAPSAGRAESPARASAADIRPDSAAAGMGVGRPAPAYAAVDLDGNPVSLAEERGAPVLLNIWATWCEPCRHELPELVTLHQRYAARGLRVIGVSVDQARTRAEIRSFVERRKVPYAIWHDPEDSASSALGTSILPASLLLSADGTVRWVKNGAVRADDPSLRAAIEQALAP